MKKLKNLTALALLSIILVSCCDCPSGTPENIITEAQAIQMQSLYAENQFQFINTGIEATYENGEPDNLGALIYDIDDFQKYIQAVKQEAAAQNKFNPGIKVTYGAVLDKNNVPRSVPFFTAIYRENSDPTEDSINYNPLDIKKLEFPSTYYDKLNPMGKEPKN